VAIPAAMPNILVMAVFFFTIMTVPFKVRDRVSAWHKGVIKW
jgi:hypothetical protein